MKTRQQAMQWWNDLFEYINPSGINKSALTEKYFGKDRIHRSLTGSEIEIIWLNELCLKAYGTDANNTSFTDRLFISKVENNSIGKNIYLERLKEQYYEVKRNFSPSENIYRETRYNAMREFCLVSQLISFNEVELMENEVNNLN